MQKNWGKLYRKHRKQRLCYRRKLNNLNLTLSLKWISLKLVVKLLKNLYRRLATTNYQIDFISLRLKEFLKKEKKQNVSF